MTSATPRPPATLTLLWCPECGRDDRMTALRESLPHRTQKGAKCEGKPIRVVYELRQA